MDAGVLVSGSVIVLLLFELAKWVAKKVTKNPDFKFEPVVFAVGVPVGNALAPFVLVYGLGYPSADAVLTLNILGVTRYVISVALASLATFFGYDGGLKPLKTYNAEMKALKLNEN